MRQIDQVCCELTGMQRRGAAGRKGLQEAVWTVTHARREVDRTPRRNDDAERHASVARNKRETPMARRREAAACCAALDVDSDSIVMGLSCQQRALELARRSGAGSIPAFLHPTRPACHKGVDHPETDCGIKEEQYG